MTSNGDANRFPYTAKAEIPLKFCNGSALHMSNEFSPRIMPWNLILSVHWTASGYTTYTYWSGSILCNPKRGLGERKFEATIKLTKIINPGGSDHSICSTMQTFIFTCNQQSKGIQMSEKKQLATCNGCAPSSDGVYTAHVDITWGFNVLNAAGSNPGDPSPEDPNYINKKLETLHLTQKLADMVFVVNKEEVPAHRLILAAMSEVFSSMFNCDSNEKKTGRVEVKDATAAGIKRMLRCIYTSWEPEWTGTRDEDVLELAYLAHKYDLKPLLMHCECRMIEILCVQNVCKILKAASTLSLESVMDPVADFIKTNKTVLQSKEWKSLEEHHPSIALKLVGMLLARCL